VKICPVENAQGTTCAGGSFECREIFGRRRATQWMYGGPLTFDRGRRIVFGLSIEIAAPERR